MGTLVASGPVRCSLGNSGGSRIRLVVGAPVILVDGNLAGGSSAPRSAATGGGSALCVGKVKAVIPSLSADVHP